MFLAKFRPRLTALSLVVTVGGDFLTEYITSALSCRRSKKGVLKIQNKPSPPQLMRGRYTAQLQQHMGSVESGIWSE